MALFVTREQVSSQANLQQETITALEAEIKQARKKYKIVYDLYFSNLCFHEFEEFEYMSKNLIHAYVEDLQALVNKQKAINSALESVRKIAERTLELNNLFNQNHELANDICAFKEVLENKE